jgi:hypothetical protein
LVGHINRTLEGLDCLSLLHFHFVFSRVGVRYDLDFHSNNQMRRKGGDIYVNLVQFHLEKNFRFSCLDLTLFCCAFMWFLCDLLSTSVINQSSRRVFTRSFFSVL